jgi:very-short-patch-repair endonuclease
MSDSKLHRIHPEMRQRAVSLRKPLTPAEQKLWARLRNRALGGFKFRRQAPLGPYIADFYCPEVHLLVEIDGSSHNDQVDYDLDRGAWFEAQGIQVIRFSNREVHQELDGVLQTILATCQRNSTD